MSSNIKLKKANEERQVATKPPLALKFVEQQSKKGIKIVSFQIDPDKEELAGKQIEESFGTASRELIYPLLNQGVNASKLGCLEGAKLSQTFLQLMYELSPKDTAESLLLSQMISCHNTAMSCLQKANLDDQYFDARIAYMKAASRFMRLFTEQLDCLNKHRGKGQQKMTVKHIHVNEGGQAIVGNISKEGGG